MPLSFVAETFLRFLFEAVFYFFGYATGWLLVPTLTFGYYTADPLAPPRPKGRRDRPGQSDARHPRQLSADATAAVGIFFWLVVGGLGAMAWWLAKP